VVVVVVLGVRGWPPLGGLVRSGLPGSAAAFGVRAPVLGPSWPGQAW
jgi:hypothetical protein